MKDEALYLLGVVAVGFAVNFGLRALPFALFAGRTRELPAWVTRVGAFVSPVIIGCLVVYSFSGLAWRTAWPYLAGLLTVALHLWKRNAFASIVAGTIVYMCLLTCGCVTARTVSLDPAAPSLVVKVAGVYFDGARVSPAAAAEILDDAGVARDRTIPILLDENVRDLREARLLMRTLAKAGYRRPVLVTRRHAEAVNVDPKKRAPAARPATPAARAPIRYKRAFE
jgi:branched-subunit amino acid transport protein AzlD